MIMMADVLPPSACVFVVQKVTDGSAQCVFAAAVVGDADARAAAAAWAKAHGVPSNTVKGGDGDEEMIAFIPGMSIGDLQDLYAASRAGKFGSARLELFAAPKAVSGDGIDMETEARLFDADLFTVPKD